MSLIVFYEKPGCQTNARQRGALQAAGHTVVVRDLLNQPWTADRLRGFFGDAPVADWFNPAARAVKAGAIAPTALDADAALAHMLADPLLIRRPLAEVDGRRSAGFDALCRNLSLALDGDARLTGCAHPDGHPPCPTPTTARD
ncbi:arsenate reductase family protein [Nitrospirillum sp. BR 11164]|uniref:ArsC/Spx/MgsR family protein n=1 Tax=Nitrospirillum sp. BR 11164 TaxID=3104324 RepID=UPI002AFFBD4D|nr:arsenate reductase family protein [Nitrospirillum sp. BR 11164]MEA1651242.1 arsenate reductase family protein [Nitrospirillum sp. BR 11164]